MKLALRVVAAAALLVRVTSGTSSRILRRSKLASEASAPQRQQHFRPKSLKLLARDTIVKGAQPNLHIAGSTSALSATSGLFGMDPRIAPASPPQYENQPGPMPGGAAGDCHPKCWWSCGNPDCDEVCEPECAPPQCETACSPINLATCRQACDPPKCAIVCPTMRCEHGDCPQCKWVCGPPVCRTECAEQCESKCADPQCTWRCNPGQCDQPKCHLTCGGAKLCGLDKDVGARPPPFPMGMAVISKGLAAMNPAVLQGDGGLVGGAVPAGPAMNAAMVPPAVAAPAAAPMSSPIR